MKLSWKSLLLVESWTVGFYKGQGDLPRPKKQECRDWTEDGLYSSEGRVQHSDIATRYVLNKQ